MLFGDLSHHHNRNKACDVPSEDALPAMITSASKKTRRGGIMRPRIAGHPRHSVLGPRSLTGLEPTDPLQRVLPQFV